MKKNKCLKTMTGEHFWKLQSYEEVTGIYQCNKCVACGMIDDRPDEPITNKNE